MSDESNDMGRVSAVSSRSTASIPLGGTTTLADLRDLLAEAEQLGAPDDARVSLLKLLGGMSTSLVVGWQPEPIVDEPVEPSALDKFVASMRADLRDIAAATAVPLTIFPAVRRIRPGHWDCNRDEQGDPYPVCLVGSGR
jgi:hypothetical protein